MTIAASLIGVVILLQGLAGLVAPQAFADLVRAIQQPPILYFAAAVRMAFGVVLVLASRTSRARAGLLALGIVVTLGGLATPFFGREIARVILGWWSQGGTPMVRAWAGGSLLLGAFIVYATWRAPARTP